ncbi:hypothetical protein [Sulfurospirillum sp. 1612]|uniref:hypothetical protein n=1 Tax=Sulfurospirillum sp. 1612 TaxID=3094835 RepID=UPI002F953A88
MIVILKHKPLLKALSLFILGLFLLFSRISTLPIVDSISHDYFIQSIEKAGIAYATCRVVNASVSVVKESNLQLEPAGVGISLAVGQVLGPVYDMVEKLSDILVLAIVSLGVQQLIYEIGVHVTPGILGVLFIMISIMMLAHNQTLKRFNTLLLQLSFLVLILRLTMPLSSIANSFIYHQYFENHIATARKNLELNTLQTDTMQKVTLPQTEGLFSTFRTTSAFISEKTDAFKEIFINTVQNAGNIIDNLLTLSFLYMGIFFIQVIFLPILSFWLIFKTIRILNHRDY